MMGEPVKADDHGMTAHRRESAELREMMLATAQRIVELLKELGDQQDRLAKLEGRA